VLKGLETLDLRAHRQSENGLKVGSLLEGRVPRINFPALPSHPQHNLAMQRHTGPNLSPFNAWVVLKGLETLDLRARRQSENSIKVGRFLEGRVPRIHHPGLPSFPQHNLAMQQMDACGPVFSFEVDGGRAQAHAVLDALELIDISNNIGDSRSLMCHNASTTHYSVSAEAREEMGVT